MPSTAPSQFPVPSGLLPAVAPRSGASDATSEALAVEEEDGAATAAALEAAAEVEDATVGFVAVAAAEETTDEAFAEAVEDVELPATADEEEEVPAADEVDAPSWTAFSWAKNVVELAGQPTPAPNKFCKVTSAVLMRAS